MTVDKIKHEITRDDEDYVEDVVRKYETDEYRQWYFRAIQVLGRPAVEELERKADRGQFPGRLFSYLIKKSLVEYDEAS